MKNFDQASFTEALASDKPVLVDFWAAWCMPCKIFAPVFEELADEMKEVADFGKVNIDDHGELASQYSVTSIPTLILFKGGEEVERIVGVKPKEMISEVIKKHA